MLKKVVAISTTSLQPKGTKTYTAKIFWLPARGYIGYTEMLNEWVGGEGFEIF